MNKKRIGEFLRELRLKNKWSQNEVLERFRDEYFQVSVKAISDWENGKSIPEIEKLLFLAELYKVTVDEILDGQLQEERNYLDEYILANSNWYQLLKDKTKSYEIHQEHRIKVVKRFKELLINKIRNEETRDEAKEFEFLFNHFYSLSNYVEKYVSSNIEDNYLKLDEAIRNKLLELKSASEEEKLFELSKFIIPTIETDIKLDEIIVDRLETNPYIDTRFKLLEWWEKDMLLMTIQKGELLAFDPSKHGADYLKRYEDISGKNFNRDKTVKNAIKYMIDNGACLNYQFINIIVKKKIKQRIIDKIEELYPSVKVPLQCPCLEEGKTYIYYAENNRKNRFILNHYYLINNFFSFLNLDIESLYEFLWKYDPDKLPKNIIIKFAKHLDIDTDREFKYVQADFNMNQFFLAPWKNYRESERKIEKQSIELKKYEELIDKGEIYNFIDSDEYIGGNDFNSMREYFYNWKNLVTLDELKKMRDKKETNRLLKNLDSYTIEDIRDEYFKEEIQEGEINDEQC